MSLSHKQVIFWTNAGIAAFGVIIIFILITLGMFLFGGSGSALPSGPNGVNVIHYRSPGDSVVYRSVKAVAVANGVASFQYNGSPQAVSNFRIERAQ